MTVVITCFQIIVLWLNNKVTVLEDKQLITQNDVETIEIKTVLRIIADIILSCKSRYKSMSNP